MTTPDTALAEVERMDLRGIVATRFELPDSDRESLRGIVARIERAMSTLPLPKTAGENGTTMDVLRSSWAELTHLLALGAAPEVRACPGCGHVAMRAATLCGHCWRKLGPDQAAG